MKKLRLYLGTIIGAILGIIAVAIWMGTFGFRPGEVNYAYKLFPLISIVLKWGDFYSGDTAPLTLWYFGGFLQWLLPGLCVDLIRLAIRVRKKSKDGLKPFWRCVALVGLGWAILMPLFLFLREYNDGSELKQLQKLQRDMNYADNKYYMAIHMNEDVRVVKYRLERNHEEMRRLVKLREQRFKEFAATLVVSSISIVVLSMYVFLVARKKADKPS